jgi:hypothetical protein
LAGLTVISTKAVEQVVSYGYQIGNIIVDGENCAEILTFAKSDHERRLMAERARNVFGREQLIVSMSDLYRDVAYGKFSSKTRTHVTQP